MVGECCKMRGFLTFLVLWIIHTKPGNGQDIAREIAKRKGDKPSCGTIYPVLKYLTMKGAIEQKEGVYHLTKKGKSELKAACKQFREIFYDMGDICKQCN